MAVPVKPKIYHILHWDRLQSIVSDGYIWCDAQIDNSAEKGTNIGMDHIKDRRLKENTLESHPGLYVGQCVPFYFCPRSVMLYLIYQGNHPNLKYTQGQKPIIHLEADLYSTVEWARNNQIRWAFTLQNAGTKYFEDRASLKKLDEIDWEAVQARYWPDVIESKQAEFLIEYQFPWELIDCIGVYNQEIKNYMEELLHDATHKPLICIKSAWYY